MFYAIRPSMKEYFPIYGAFHIRYTGLRYTLRHSNPPRFTSKIRTKTIILDATHFYPNLNERYL